MMDPSSQKFISTLVKNLQLLCHANIEYHDNIEIVGYINIRIDNKRKLDYIVNELCSRQGSESTVFQSASYHSLPSQVLCSRAQEEPQSSSHVADIGPNGEKKLQVPNTSTVNARSLLSMTETCQSSSNCATSASDIYVRLMDSSVCDSDFMDCHSSLMSSSDEQHTICELPVSHVKELPVGDGRMSDGSPEQYVSISDKYRSGHRSLRAVCNDPDKVMHCLPVGEHSDNVKLEPGVQYSQALLNGEVDVEPCGVSLFPPMCPSSASQFHSPGRLFSSSSNGHTNVELSVTSYSDNIYSNAPDRLPYCQNGEISSEGLPRMASQVVEAMSLVTRTRSPPNLKPPPAAIHFPQTAEVKVKERQCAVEKNQCEHCSKLFRTSDLLKMHVTLIHTHGNIMSPKSLRNTPSFMTSLRSPCSSSGAPFRHTNRPATCLNGVIITTTISPPAPGQCHSQSSVFSATNAQSQHPQPLTLPTACRQSEDSTGTTARFTSLPSFHSTLSSGPATAAKAESDHTTSAVAGMCAALEQTYSMERSLAGPERGCRTVNSFPLSPYHCHLCRAPFVTWPLLAQHQAQCVRRGSHCCDMCSKAFRSKTSLTDHINTIHRGVLFICKGCNETFKWRTHIYQHRRKCPALQSAGFETGGFFIEETGPQDAHHSTVSSSPPRDPAMVIDQSEHL